MRRSSQITLAVMLALLVLLSACSGASGDEGGEPSSGEPLFSEPPDDAIDSDSSISPALTLVPGSSQASDSGIVNIGTQTLGPGQGTLLLDVTMPYGYKFNDLAPFTMSITAMGSSIEIDDTWTHFEEIEPTMPMEIPLMLSDGEAILMLDLAIYWCEAIQQTLCFVDQERLSTTISIDPGATNHIATVDIALVPPTS